MDFYNKKKINFKVKNIKIPIMAVFQLWQYLS